MRYIGSDGQVMAEDPLTGVSSYRQREQEIQQRLAELCGGKSPESAQLADSGEYSG